MNHTQQLQAAMLVKEAANPLFGVVGSKVGPWLKRPFQAMAKGKGMGGAGIRAAGRAPATVGQGALQYAQGFRNPSMRVGNQSAWRHAVEPVMQIPGAVKGTVMGARGHRAQAYGSKAVGKLDNLIDQANRPSGAGRVGRSLRDQQQDIYTATAKRYGKTSPRRLSEEVAKPLIQQGRQLRADNTMGSALLAGGGIYGTAQGVGFGAGALAADKSGDRQAQSMKDLSPTQRLQYLFDPKGYAQQHQQTLRDSQQGLRALNWLPGAGGFRAGMGQVQRIGDRQLVNQLGSTSWLQRLLYMLAPHLMTDAVQQQMNNPQGPR